MTLQPVLTGKVLSLSPTRGDDFDSLYKAASDPLIWEQHPARDRWKLDAFRKFFDGAIASGGALTVRELATGEVIGSSRYYAWNAVERHVAIGYTFLVRRCWGGSFNREMKKLMLDHAFTFVDRVWFHIGSDNIRSRKAIEVIGARFDHEVLADPAWGGVNMAYYVIDRSVIAPSVAR